MTNKNDEKHQSTSDLTTEQQHLLSETLNQVEVKLFLEVLKRLRVYLVVTASFVTLLLTLLGAFTFTGIRSTVVESVASRLSDDTDVKRQVVENAAINIETATGLVAKCGEFATRLEREDARLTATLATELEEIHGMLKQIREDLQDLGDKPDGTARESE